MNVRRSLSVFAIVAAGLSLVACHNNGGDGTPRDPSTSRRVTDSPLHAAADRNDDQTIKALTSQGTDANVTLKNGRTALHVAAAGSQMRAATALLAAGADPSRQDDRGDTPLM